MKTEQGLVVEVIDNVAKVRVGRHSDCKNCGACPGSESVIITVSNEIRAKPGQRVIFEAKETNMLWAAFIVFILPLIALFIGAMVGGVIGKYTGFDILICQVIGGIVSAILAVLLIKKLDRDTEKSGKSQPKIIRILK